MRRILACLFLCGLGLVPASADAGMRREDHRLLLPPVRPACISSPFGPRFLPNHPMVGTFHYGIDLPAPLGTPVKAVAPGTLIRVQHNGIGGLEMLIQHDGFVGVYSHLGMTSPLLGEPGRPVYGGEAIGTVGHTGLTFGPHLYFGVIRDGRPVDPAPLLRVKACAAGWQADTETRLLPTRMYAGG